MTPKPRAGTLRGDIALTVASQAIVAATMFVQYWLVRRYWGIEAFSGFSLVVRVRGAIEWILLLQIPLAMARSIAVARHDDERRRLAAGGLVAGLLLVGAWCGVFLAVPRVAAEALLGRAGNSDWILPLSALLLAYSAFLLVSGALRGRFEFRRANLLNVAAISFAPTAVIALGRGHDVRMIVVAAAVASLATTAVGGWGAWRVPGGEATGARSATWHDSLASVRVLLVYGLPRLATLALSACFVMFLPWILARDGETGALAEVNSLLAVLAGAGLISAPAGFVLLPRFSAAVAGGLTADATVQLRLLVAATLFAGTMASLCASALLDLVVSVILGRSPLENGYLLAATALAVPLFLLVDVLRGPLDAVAKFPFNAVVFAAGFLATALVYFAPWPVAGGPTTRSAASLLAGYLAAAGVSLLIAGRMYATRIFGRDEIALAAVWLASGGASLWLVAHGGQGAWLTRIAYLAAAGGLGLYALATRPRWLAALVPRRSTP